MRVWDNLLNGRIKRDTQLEQVGLTEAVLRTVGGHIIVEDGQIIPIDHFRYLLTTWLQPGRPSKSAPRGAAADLGTFLVSWGLSFKADAVKRWRDAGCRPRLESRAHLERAVAWDSVKPAFPESVWYPYVAVRDMDPEKGAGRLVDAAVRRLLNADSAWLHPKPSDFEHRIRDLLRDRAANLARLFETTTDVAHRTPTTEVTRLAAILAAGAALADYIDASIEVAGDSEQVRALADEVLPRWTNPPALLRLRQLAYDYGALRTMARSGSQVDLRSDYDDLRAILDAFAEKGRDFGNESPPPRATLPRANSTPARRLSALLELAVADVRDNSTSMREAIAPHVLRVLSEIRSSVDAQKDLEQLVDVQHRLLEPRIERRPDHREYRTRDLHGVLARLREGGRQGATVPSRADRAASPEEVAEFLFAVEYHAREGNLDALHAKLAASMPEVVTALESGAAMADPLPSVEDFRWKVLVGAARVLTHAGTLPGGPVIAGAFADLAWVAADDQTPERMRSILDPVTAALRRVSAGGRAPDVPGALARIERARPLAESKHARFSDAQDVARHSVRFATLALRRALDPAPNQTVNRIMAALTGLQLSLLQAGGVFVRSAESELIAQPRRRSRAERLRHTIHIRNLATASFTYTNFAVGRLHDIEQAKAGDLITEKELNFPRTSAASTAAMGMRTLMLWATMQLVEPRGAATRTDIRTLVRSVPDQFRRMLRLPHLSDLNFGDMTRIALFYAFLSGDLGHPSVGASAVNPRTPAHLGVDAGPRLDVEACGAYLTRMGYDTGILDVIERGDVWHKLNETSDGMFEEWRSGYHNPVKRRPERVRPADVSFVAVDHRDTTVRL